MKRIIGFSTGALAKGDFHRGIRLAERESLDAIELSALRVQELEGAITSLPLIAPERFVYRSFHAPSDFGDMNDEQAVEMLSPVADSGYKIVLHPDAIRDFTPWKKLGSAVLLENMDTRKPGFRTSRELLESFQKLPEARFCLDIGHAHRVDPSMGVAIDLLLRRVADLEEVHISEVNWDCRHCTISTPAALAFQRVASRIPENVPIIIESVVSDSKIDAEINMVRRCLDPNEQLLRHRPDPTTKPA